MLGPRILLACASVLAAAPAAAADWSAEIGATSDYRYRGVSLSGSKPALQGGLAYELDSGVYGELWSSTLGSAGNVEVDVTAGISRDLADGLSIDVSTTYYAYPGTNGANAVEASASIEATRGPLSLSLGASVAPPQAGTRDDSGVKRPNLYLFAGASYAVLGLPVTARASIGRERGAWDMVEGGSKWDWAIGLETDLTRVRASLGYAGSNASGDGLVAGLSLAF